MDERIPRIVQIAPAAPVGQLADISNKPILFGLAEDGSPWFWNWHDKRWDHIKDIDD